MGEYAGGDLLEASVEQSPLTLDQPVDGRHNGVAPCSAAFAGSAGRLPSRGQAPSLPSC